MTAMPPGTSSGATPPPSSADGGGASLAATSVAKTTTAIPMPPPRVDLERQARHILISDLVCIAAALSAGVAAGWGEGAPLPADPSRLLVGVAIAVLWPFTLWWRETRDESIFAGGGDEYRRVVVASAAMVLGVATLAYFTDTSRARSFLIGVAVSGTLLLLAERWLLRVRLQARLNSGTPLHRVYVIAPPAQLRELEGELANSRNRFVVVGSWAALTDEPEPQVLIDRAMRLGADTVLLSPPPEAGPVWLRRLGWAMEDTGMHLMVSPALVRVAGPRIRVRQVQDMSLLLVEIPKFSGPARVFKRTVDVVGSALMLLFLALPMAVIAVVVRVDSTGPALFRQTRMGSGGRTFTCFKFRTMTVGADAELEDLRADSGQKGATFKLPEDPRVTRVGGFLRRRSLDELPQLWNVLLGQMSLVGPRPHQMSDVARYDDVASRRLLAKPGMTGLWQVSGRSDTTWQDNVMLDLYYVENWSAAMDFVIMLKTVKAVVTGSGAY